LSPSPIVLTTEIYFVQLILEVGTFVLKRVFKSEDLPTEVLPMKITDLH
jgi:hypothetical protein